MQYCQAKKILKPFFLLLGILLQHSLLFSPLRTFETAYLPKKARFRSLRNLLTFKVSFLHLKGLSEAAEQAGIMIPLWVMAVSISR